MVAMVTSMGFLLSMEMVVVSDLKMNGLKQFRKLE